MAEELSLDHFDLGTFVDYVHALKQERDALRAQAIQDGEAVEVVTTWHPDSRSYEEQIVKHDTKGSRKSLGAMNAKLRAKVGRLERELSTVKQSLTVPLEPTEEMLDVAVSFALNVSLSGEYNWSTYMRDVWQRMVKAAPPSPDAELVELLRDMVAMMDSGDEHGAGSEWHTEAVAALARIDAKLAEMQSCEP